MSKPMGLNSEMKLVPWSCIGDDLSPDGLVQGLGEVHTDIVPGDRVSLLVQGGMELLMVGYVPPSSSGSDPG